MSKINYKMGSRRLSALAIGMSALGISAILLMPSARAQDAKPPAAIEGIAPAGQDPNASPAAKASSVDNSPVRVMPTSQTNAAEEIAAAQRRTAILKAQIEEAKARNELASMSLKSGQILPTGGPNAMGAGNTMGPGNVPGGSSMGPGAGQNYNPGAAGTMPVTSVVKPTDAPAAHAAPAPKTPEEIEAEREANEPPPRILAIFGSGNNFYASLRLASGIAQDVRVGDNIGGQFKVKRITTESVILTRAGKDYSLRIFSSLAAGAPPVIATQPSAYQPAQIQPSASPLPGTANAAGIVPMSGMPPLPGPAMIGPSGAGLAGSPAPFGLRNTASDPSVPLDFMYGGQ